VVAFRSNVKIMTETPRLPTISNPRRKFCFLVRLDEIPPPIITGRRGNIHGANVVRIPARNDTTSSVIALLL